MGTCMMLAGAVLYIAAMKEALRRWYAVRNPGTFHKHLEQLVGGWNVVMRFYLGGPKGPALESKCTAKKGMILGGRFKWKDQGQTPNVQFAIYDFGETKLIFEVSNVTTNRDRPKTVFDSSSSAGRIEIKMPPDVKNPASERGPGGGIFKNFIACVRSRKPEDLDAHVLEGQYSSALCHLANISYRLGREVPFDKKSKSFGGDKEVYRTWEWFQDTLKDNGLKLEETVYRVARMLKFDPGKEKFIGNPQADRLLTRPPFVVPEKVV